MRCDPFALIRMNDLLRLLEPFRLDGALDERFKQILSGTSLQRDDALDRALRDYRRRGVYFWVLRHRDACYRIYVGQTVSLSGRLRTYISSFQAHSPNDFKLQVFLAFVNELLPDATFDLYFFDTPDDLNAAELQTIERYNPLLNRLPQPSLEAREQLKRAFSLYYASVFQRRLKE